MIFRPRLLLLAFVASVGANISACSLLTDDDGAKTDSLLASRTCTAGQTRSCYSGPPATEGIGVCQGGTQGCVDGLWGPCAGEVLPSKERCDGRDNDCNGIFDDGCSCQPEQTKPCYAGPAATEGVGVCGAGVHTCVKGRWSKLCFGARTPTPEQCDRADNDCNGVVDEGLDCKCTNGQTRSCYTGPQSADGVGVCKRGSQRCEGGNWGPCNGDVMPGVEVCNGLDENCDGIVDNGAPCPGGLQCSDGQCVTIPSSCPYVYAHDGKGFVYETSVGGSGSALIGGPSDLAVGRALRFAPMLARLGHAAVDAKRHAQARILIAEDEIGYVDEAHLTVVDHPTGYEVFTTTSLDWTTRRDPQELIALRTASLRAPRAASWNGERDVTSEIGSLDDRAVAYDKAAENYYELDFGAVKDPRRARLVVDGWKYREPRGLSPGVRNAPPHVEIQKPNGVWVTAARFPYPRGDRKAVVLDLGLVDWPKGEYRMRFYTGTSEGNDALWYVDRVRLTEDAPAPVKVTELAPSKATLAWRGAPTYIDEKDRGHPRWNKDDGLGYVDPEPLSGNFTRYGEVKRLLEASDDIFVVMRQGDGLTFDFDAIPRAAAGRTQTFFLRTELLFKSRLCPGCTEPTPLTSGVLPLPFHAMSRYPYGETERFPDDEAHRAWLAEFQTRTVSPR